MQMERPEGNLRPFLFQRGGKVRLRSIIAAACLITTSAAPAAELCRDSKGLFTPCPSGPARKVSHHSRDEGQPAAASGPQGATKSDRTARRTRRGPELFAKGKLCRDSKGLATPCPR
jgi:hypothetical protein